MDCYWLDQAKPKLIVDRKGPLLWTILVDC